MGKTQYFKIEVLRSSTSKVVHTYFAKSNSVVNTMLQVQQITAATFAFTYTLKVKRISRWNWLVQIVTRKNTL